MEALCTRLHKLGALAPARFPGEAREVNQTFANPQSLLHAVAGNRNFCRDSTLASLFHGRKISFREVSPSDSLHLVFNGAQVSVHADLLSPLNFDPRSQAQYSPARVVAHNLAELAELAGHVVRLINHGLSHRNEGGGAVGVGAAEGGGAVGVGAAEVG